MERLPSVGWLGWVILGAALAALGLSASWVRARVRYELDGNRQALWIELRLLFGLWHRRWRVPSEGDAPLLPAGRPGRRTREKPASGRDSGRTGPDAGPSPAWRGIEHMRRRVRLQALRLDVRVGTGDAALTALTVGGAHAVLGTALALLPAYVRTERLRPTVRVQPDYAAERLQASGDCIAATRLGHLMVAVALAWWTAHHRSGRRSAKPSAP